MACVFIGFQASRAGLAQFSIYQGQFADAWQMANSFHTHDHQSEATAARCDSNTHRSSPTMNAAKEAFGACMTVTVPRPGWELWLPEIITAE